MDNSIKQILINLLPDNAQYIGDLFKEDDYYFCTIEVLSGENIIFKTREFEVVSIINDLGVYIKIKIDAKYLEYLNACSINAKSEAEQILLKIPIEIFSLSPHTKKLLKEISIFTLRDLVSHSPNGLSKIKFISEKIIDDIENILSEVGLKLSKK